MIDIESCRTLEIGGHVDECGHVRVSYKRGIVL
ncbi:transposase zinc-binding domain-containing protein [Clostridium estertheticum]|nr:transposase zinc-binding domain-containing protein [Clostridium estertheticum]